jgi:hypothetical protein
MITNNIYHQKLVADYIEHGFAPIPIHHKSKQPVSKGWPDLRISNNDIDTYFNEHPINIGILTGQPSQGLVDIDIDDTAALRFAPWFLPETKCVFGRASKPKSHWVYRVPEPRTQEKFKTDGMIVEVRGNRLCTVFPGSVHESGEAIEFDNPHDYRPGQSTWNELKRAASKIAIATGLFKAWVPGQRHELTLCTAAKLARLGWSADEARHLIQAVATEAQDEELDDRLVAVESTFDAYAQRQQISGEERFDHLVGAEIAANIHKWACPPESLKIAPYSGSENEGQPATADLSTDSGAADAFATEFKNDLIYCDKGWFLRRNQVFEPVGPEVVQGLAKDFLQNQVGKVTAGPVAYSPLKSCLTRTRINAVIELSRAQLYVQSDTLDEDRNLVGCPDGYVLDLNAGSMSDGVNSIVTKKLGTNFTAGSTCPEWTKFLQQIFDGNLELITFIQEQWAIA